MPRHWAVLIGDLRQISPPLGFIVNFCLVALPARGHLAICRHLSPCALEKRAVAVPYHTWRVPSATLPHPVWRDVQPGFSAGALAGVFISNTLPHRNEIWEAGAEPHAP